MILWGAFVRATGSGAGCGSHWPLCNGVVIPQAPEIKTIIEFTHRATSGLNLIFVILLFIWALRAFPKNHLVRRGAFFSLLFIILEALLGAGLVLLELVAYDQSLQRTVSIALHLVNTSFLMAFLVATWRWSYLPIQTEHRFLFQDPSIKKQCFWMAGAYLILSMMGAVTALGDTLFPAQSLAQGITQDFSKNSHFLIQFRIFHPIVAILFIALGSIWLTKTSKIRAELLTTQGFPKKALTIRRFSKFTAACLGINLILGFSNLLLLAPIALQILHLLVANLILIGLSGFIIELGTQKK